MTAASLRRLALAAATAIAVTACGSDAGPTSTGANPTGSAPADGTAANPTDSDASTASVTLVVYDSFPTSDTSLNDALGEFSAETGIDVDLLVAGDTGTMLAKASLTAGNPEGDVMWGVDNTLLSRAIADEVFEPYRSPVTSELAPDLLELVPDGEATPVDFGDVCVNVDRAWFAERDLAPPTMFGDLSDPAYADLLVVQNPATSSPGLAFLLATIDEYGEDGWRDYWTSLRDNGVRVVDGWTEAYYEQFTWAGGGDRPLVVSYGTSPPAEVLFADPPITDPAAGAPTSVVETTCFRQVEFAGILRGTDAPDEARALVDFLAGETFQRELALNLFVYPANTNVQLPPEFDDYAVVPDAPRSLEPTVIDANRATWVDEWTDLVLG